MENWGAIIYRESALLIDDKTASVGAKQGVAETIAHEMAPPMVRRPGHDGLVDDIWLNEGFATWMTPHPIESWKPDWMESQEVVENTDRALAGLGEEHPSHSSASRDAVRTIEQLLMALPTASRPLSCTCWSRMWDLKPSAPGQLYLKEHAYGNASAADFWGAMARASKKPIDEIMPTFVCSPARLTSASKPSAKAGNTTLNLSQKRYFDTPAAFNQSNEQDLADPGLRQGHQPELGRKQQCFAADAAPAAVHAAGVARSSSSPTSSALGYYRFDYDAAAMRQLGNAVDTVLTPDGTHRVDRQRVGADAHRQAQCGRLSGLGRPAEEHPRRHPAGFLRSAPEHD